MSILGGFAGFGGLPLGGSLTGNPLGGLVSSAAGSAAGFVLQNISSWVLEGTRGAILEVASVIGAVTAPNLDSTWFSSTYWRVAALAAMLTIPFLCAAAVQAVARADLGLLARTAFGYLPLSLLGVSLAAPMTMLALAATDQMSAAVSASAATGGARFLDHAAGVAGSLATAAGGSPFFAVVVGLLALLAAMALAIELLIRAAAVYVVVLMLPLAFAALVWPARRMWAVRVAELLASLILSKFVIVAVLSLASAAFTSGTPGIGELLVAMSLILLSTCAPWALMRILPFTELAAGAAGILRSELPVGQAHAHAAQLSAGAGGLAMELPARLRDHARAMYAGSGNGSQPEPSMSPASARTAEQPLDGGFAESSGSGSGSTPEPLAGPSAASGPSTASGESAAFGASAAPATSQSEDERPPYVLPDAWRGDQPVRLDESLLRPPDAPSSTPDQPESPQ